MFFIKFVIGFVLAMIPLTWGIHFFFGNAKHLSAPGFSDYLIVTAAACVVVSVAAGIFGVVASLFNGAASKKSKPAQTRQDGVTTDSLGRIKARLDAVSAGKTQASQEASGLDQQFVKAGSGKPDAETFEEIAERAFAFARQNEKPSIALIRPYPPPRGQTFRSRIGGLPELPRDAEWPRLVGPGENFADVDDAPLHFMAQLDLSELPAINPLIPRTGTLLFFALMNEDMIWSGEQGAVRVIYDSTSSGKTVAPPDDIGPLQGGHNHFDKAFRQDSEDKRVVHESWPLVGKAVQTLPGMTELPMLKSHLAAAHYEMLANRYMVSQFSADGAPVSRGRVKMEDTQWITVDDSQQERPSARCVSDLFASPRINELLVRALCRHINQLKQSLPAYRAQQIDKAKAERDETQQERLDRKIEQIDFTLNALPGLLVKGASLQNMFSNMLKSRSLSTLENAEFVTWLEATLQLQLGSTFSRFLSEAVLQAVSESGGEPALADHLHADAWAFAEHNHRVVHGSSRPSKDETSYAEFHQMLGHIQTTQWDSRIDSTDICLLQLRSDYGVNLMICDVGEMEFWIKSDDLRKLDFSKVWGTTQGG